MKKVIVSSMLMMMVGIGVPVATYAHGAHDDAVEINLSEVSLADWEGSWNSESAFYQEDVVQKAFKEAAEKDGVSEEEYKEKKEKRRHVDFDHLVVKDGQVSFYKDKEGMEDNELIDQSKYSLERAETVEHGGSTLYWFIFKAEKEDAEYPYLLLMDIHGEDVLAHFHLRYAKDEAEIKELLEADDWYPEFISSDVSAEQVANAILH